MLKRIFVMAAAALMAVTSVNAQVAGDVSYRFRGGVNMSTMTSNDDSKYKVGWTLGTGIDFCFSDQFSLGLDICHDMIGAKSKSLDENLNLEYLGIGPLVRLYAKPWMSLYAGPQINFLTSAKVDDHSYKSFCEKTEFSVPIGISFEPMVGKRRNVALIIDLRYRLGLSNVNKEQLLGNEDTKNSAFILTIGYKNPF